MDLKEIVREGGDLIYLAKDRDRWRNVVHTVKISGSIKSCELFE